MIGVFDSGLGGIQTLRYLKDVLPQYSYCYLGDTAGLPYGTKDPQRIHDRTFACCEWLFAQGCHLVILACNSASTYAVRSRQQHYPERKVLSVTVPGIEVVVEKDLHHIGVLGTKATIESNLYPSFFSRHFPEHKIIVEQMVGGDLVPMIEEGVSSEIIDQECKRVVEHFSNDIEALVLGCTHYPVIESLIQKNLPEGVLCIDPAKEAANGLASYLSRHPEVEQLLQQSGTVTFHITKESIPFHKVGSTIWGTPFGTTVVTI